MNPKPTDAASILGKLGGKKRTPKKAEASKRNGKLGGFHATKKGKARADNKRLNEISDRGVWIGSSRKGKAAK